MTEPPIDATEPIALQSRHALRLSDELGLLIFRWPLDMTNEAQVAATLDELGPECQLPDDTLGAYYYAIITNPGEAPFPVIMPEGAVRDIVVGLGLARGVDVARKVLYRVDILPA